MTTVGVIDALMLSFVVPSLSSIPNSLSYDPDDPNLETRLWFWFSFLSVVLSIASLILATIMLTYMTPVPARREIQIKNKGLTIPNPSHSDVTDLTTTGECLSI